MDQDSLVGSSKGEFSCSIAQTLSYTKAPIRPTEQQCYTVHDRRTCMTLCILKHSAIALHAMVFRLDFMLVESR